MRLSPSVLSLAACAAFAVPASAQPTPTPVPAAPAARVIGAKLEANPRVYKGKCPVTIKFVGSIETSGPATVKYVFDRNDGAIDTNDRHFTAVAPFHQPVETTWTLGGPGMHYAGWEQIRILAPNAGFRGNKAEFEITCDGAPAGGGGKPSGQPDLTITDVSVGAVTGISRAVRLTVRNVGTGPASHFTMGAFQLAPRRWPLLFTACALTVDPRGGSAPCGGVWEAGTLAAGASRTYAGFVTFPTGRTSKSVERVEFMADECFPPLSPAMPASCRVLESNEANNTSVVEVGVP